MEFFSPEIIEKLLDYPVLLAVFYILWSMGKTTGRLLDIVEKLANKEQ